MKKKFRIIEVEDRYVKYYTVKKKTFWGWSDVLKIDEYSGKPIIRKWHNISDVEDYVKIEIDYKGKIEKVIKEF